MAALGKTGWHRSSAHKPTAMRYAVVMPSGANERPLRVAHLIQTYCVGGIERMVLDLARAIASHGVHCEAIAYVRDGEMRAAFDQAGVRTTMLRTRPGIQLRLGASVARVLRDHQIDVLHSHHLGPFLYGTAAAGLTLTPHVHTEHSVELYDRGRRRSLARLMPRVCRLVHVAPEVADWRRRHLGGAGQVVPNGVPVPDARTAETTAQARRQYGLDDDAFVVGCVARLEPEKDHVTLVEAFAAVVAARPESRLVLVGDGSTRSAIEARVAALDLGAHVTLLGTLLDVQSVLPALDVKVLSSLREGLPIALLEAMAHGIPVVATEVGGLPGLLRDGGGALVPPARPAALAAALVTYAEHPARRRDDGAAARALVIDRYSLEAMASAYAAIYRQVAR